MSFKPLLDFVALIFKVLLVCFAVIILGVLGMTLVRYTGLEQILRSYPHEISIALILVVLFCLVAVTLLAAKETKLIKTVEKEPTFPSVYQYVSRQLSLIKWYICVCIASIIGLSPIITFAHTGRYEIVRTTGPFLLRIFFFVYIFILAMFIIAFFRINLPVRRLYRRVDDSIREGTLVANENPACTRLLTKQSDELGLNVPTFWIARKLESWMPGCSFVLARTREDSKIIMAEDYLNSLSKEELESVFSHELWHVKMESTVLQLMVFNWGAFFYFLGKTLIFACGILIIPAFLLTGSHSLPSPFSNPLIYMLLSMPEVFGVFLLSYGFPDDSRLFMFSFILPDQEEYFGDSMSILTVKRPKKLISALLRSFGLKDACALEFASLTSSEYKRILNPALINLPRASILKNRIKQAYLIDNILSHRLSIHSTRKLKKFSLFEFFGLNLKLYFSPFARALAQIKKEKIESIYNYIKSESRNFNILECAQQTSSALTESFIVFACAIMGGIITDFHVTSELSGTR